MEWYLLLLCPATSLREMQIAVVGCNLKGCKSLKLEYSTYDVTRVVGCDSMEGTICNLPEIIRLKKKYKVRYNSVLRSDVFAFLFFCWRHDKMDLRN